MKNIPMPNTESIKNEIAKLVEKYNTVARNKQVGKYNEEMTKKDFILPLFRALGWNTEDSNEVTAEENISKKRVDYGFRINGIPKFFLEAKALREDLENPKFIEQAINYAWHKGCTWAVLTDFESVKIFNAEWRTSNPLQSHLKTIPCQEFISRFDELWLLSKESFEQGLIDKEAEKWGKKTKKISVNKQLLADFTRFRELLSKNIAKLNRSKNLTEEDLDESVQRILDRLIFIRNCEDRELEAKSLISSLREWESWGKGQFIKYLREVFAYFDKLYNSKIFANHLCDDLDIDNEVLDEIIEGLYYTKDNSVSYDFSAIEADVLGNIYEQYLGHILKKSEKRAKLTKSHTHRKEQGIYYTPTYIVDFIVRNTLGELLKDKRVDPEKIRVLDPACGSGSFLIKAFDVLNEHYARYDKNYSQSQMDFKTGLPFTAKVKILENNIFGVDLDKQAVEIAQLNLLLKIAEKGQRLPLLQQNIKCGNSLIDDPAIAGDKAFRWEEEFKHIMDDGGPSTSPVNWTRSGQGPVRRSPDVVSRDEGGFDVVIGNPPYVRIHEFEENYKKYFSANFNSSTGQYDIYVLFIEKALQLLRDGGLLGFIVSNKFLVSDYGVGLRNTILSKTKIRTIVDVSNIRVFKEASVYPVVIIMEKLNRKGSRKDHKVKIIQNVLNSRELLTKKGDFVNQIEFQKNKEQIIDITSSNKDLITKIEEGSVCLDEIAKISRGFRPPKKELTSNKISKGVYKYLIGKDLKRAYNINWSGNCVRYDEKQIAESKPLRTFLQQKILIRDIGKKFNACYDKGEFLCLKTIYFLYDFKHNDLKYLLGVLNSKLMLFYFQSKFSVMHIQGGYLRFRKQFLIQLPIKTITETKQQPIIKLVDKMLSLNKRLNEIGDKKTDERARIEEEIKKPDVEIDELVYQIYSITEEEKKIIEESLK